MGYYQPLNGDTQYKISGQISTNYQAHEYAFYADAGSLVSISASLAKVTGYYLDGGISGYNLTDLTSKFDIPFSVNGTASVQFRAITSGVFVIFLEVNYTDAPSPLTYSINISGAAKPGITVTSPTSKGNAPKTFYISAAPSLPTVNAVITGVVPDDLSPTTFHWKTQVDYTGPRNSRTGADDSSTHSPIVKHDVTSSTKYSPKMSDLGYYGGDLTMSFTTTIDGLQVSATTRGAGFRILGENPTLDQIQRVVATLRVPSVLSQSTYGFDKIIRSLIQKESSGSQFTSSGYPVLNSRYDGGGGLMQVTYHRSDADYWNWQTNIRDGYNLLVSGLNTATARLTVSSKKLASLAAANGLSVDNLSVQKATPDQMMFNAISMFGPNAGLYYELDQDTNGNLIVTKTGSGKSAKGRITIIQNAKYSHEYVNSVILIYGQL